MSEQEIKSLNLRWSHSKYILINFEKFLDNFEWERDLTILAKRSEQAANFDFWLIFINQKLEALEDDP